jgi:N-acetyl-alpha-D-muramate 1-phosphate uridylyltransferase
MHGKINKAMVLAAGYGTRLKPLTDRMPKPLVPVAGRPMIAYALDKLRAYGIHEIVINVSHHKEQLTAWLAGIKDLTIKISEEVEPLETGGGLRHALPLLGNEPLFFINSDIIWTDENSLINCPRIEPLNLTLGRGHTQSSSHPPAVPSPLPSDGRGEGQGLSGHSFRAQADEVWVHGQRDSALTRLAEHWNDAKMDFLLLAQPKAKAIGHEQGEDHLFIKPGNTIGWNEQDAPYIVAGIGIFHPRVLAGAPEGKFSVKVLWQQALAQNRLFCLPHHGRWFQTGTIADIKKAEEQFKAAKLD